MLTATVKINRPIVAKIIRGVNLETSRKTGVERLVEKAIVLGKGLYVMTRICGQNIIHIQHAETLEKYRAFVDDFESLRDGGTIEVVGTHKRTYIPAKKRKWSKWTCVAPHTT